MHHQAWKTEAFWEWLAHHVGLLIMGFVVGLGMHNDGVFSGLLLAAVLLFAIVVAESLAGQSQLRDELVMDLKRQVEEEHAGRMLAQEQWQHWREHALALEGIRPTQRSGLDVKN